MKLRTTNNKDHNIIEVLDNQDEVVHTIKTTKDFKGVTAVQEEGCVTEFRNWTSNLKKIKPVTITDPKTVVWLVTHEGKNLHPKTKLEVRETIQQPTEMTKERADKIMERFAKDPGVDRLQEKAVNYHQKKWLQKGPDKIRRRISEHSAILEQNKIRKATTDLEEIQEQCQAQIEVLENQIEILEQVHLRWDQMTPLQQMRVMSKLGGNLNPADHDQ